MSILDRLDRLAGGACARAFGEPVLIRPMTRGRISGAVPDPERPEGSVIAEFHLAPEAVGLMEARREGKSAIGATMLAAGGAWLSITATAARSLGWTVREGDLVVLSRRPGKPAWRIACVGTDDLGAVLLDLARAAST